MFNKKLRIKIFGQLEYWNIGILEYWNIGILEYWNISNIQL